MPNGEWIMNSYKIADALEAAFPEPSLHLDSPYLPRVRKAMVNGFTQIHGVYIPLVPVKILNPASVPYFVETRSKEEGMSLEQFAKEHGGPKAWEKAEPWMREATALLKEDPTGPFFMGKTVSYADFIWASMLIFLPRLGDDVFEAFLKASGDGEVHLAFLEGLKLWSVRDDH
jgi:glutathione S-transferase